MANPNHVELHDVDAPHEQLIYDGKQVELSGGRVGAVVITNGNLKLHGDVEIGQVVVVNPLDGKGKADNGLYLGGVSGWIGFISTLGTRRDHGKIGSGTHDLTIGSWYGRCAPPDPTPEGQAPVHRDGLQIQQAQRVRIVWFDFANFYPGATNGGIFIAPNKSDEEIDPSDPTFCVDVVLEGGRIANPNKGVTLGPSTRCGARDTLLIAQRPFEIGPDAIDPIDVGNTKHVIDLGV